MFHHPLKSRINSMCSWYWFLHIDEFNFIYFMWHFYACVCKEDWSIIFCFMQYLLGLHLMTLLSSWNLLAVRWPFPVDLGVSVYLASKRHRLSLTLAILCLFLLLKMVCVGYKHPRYSLSYSCKHTHGQLRLSFQRTEFMPAHLICHDNLCHSF